MTAHDKILILICPSGAIVSTLYTAYFAISGSTEGAFLSTAICGIFTLGSYAVYRTVKGRSR